MVPQCVTMAIYARSFCSLAGHGWAFRPKGERKQCGGIPRGYEGQVMPTTHHTHCQSMTGLSKIHTSNWNLEALESCWPSERRTIVLSRKILDHTYTARLNRTLFVLFHCISTLKVVVVMATLLCPPGGIFKGWCCTRQSLFWVIFIHMPNIKVRLSLQFIINTNASSTREVMYMSRYRNHVR